MSRIEKTSKGEKYVSIRGAMAILGWTRKKTDTLLSSLVDETADFPFTVRFFVDSDSRTRWVLKDDVYKIKDHRRIRVRSTRPTTEAEPTDETGTTEETGTTDETGTEPETPEETEPPAETEKDSAA
jgi:hypothetical protein